MTLDKFLDSDLVIVLFFADKNFEISNFKVKYIAD